MSQLFKVLVDGRSCHGGALSWSLPKDGKPGGWHEADGKLRLCHNGFHLTDWVGSWWKPGCKAYLVDAEGVEGECSDDNERKVVARRVRLVRELTEAELAVVGVFVSGQHKVAGARKHIALESSSVEAGGSSRVEAWGSSRVVARESSSVVARESSVKVAVADGPLVRTEPPTVKPKKKRAKRKGAKS